MASEPIPFMINELELPISDELCFHLAPLYADLYGSQVRLGLHSQLQLACNWHASVELELELELELEAQSSSTNRQLAHSLTGKVSRVASCDCEPLER